MILRFILWFLCHFRFYVVACGNMNRTANFCANAHLYGENEEERERESEGENGRGGLCHCHR